MFTRRRPGEGGLPRIVGESFRPLTLTPSHFVPCARGSLFPSGAARPERCFGCDGAALGGKWSCEWQKPFAEWEARSTVRRVIQHDQAIEEARRAGFDLDLLASNLALSPAERWRQHNLALEMALELQQARPIRDAKLRSAPAPAR